MPASKTLAVCIAEDRATEVPGIQLAVASTRRFNAEIDIHVFCPNADVDLISWLNAQGKLYIHAERLTGPAGWNVKPQALLAVLDAGYDQVVWIDSDVIVTKDIADVFAGIPPDVLIVADEALWARNRRDAGARAEGWGFPVDRRLDTSINSCVLRVSQDHRALLLHWRDLLGDEAFQAAQAGSFHSRPVHLVSDQDVLTAILSSPPFSAVPLHALRIGSDIIQFFGLHGFTIKDRLKYIRSGLPAFVHSQGPKPWSGKIQSRQRRQKIINYIDYVYKDTSPYTLISRGYDCNIRDHSVWSKPKTVIGAVLRFLGAGSIPLAGLPIALSAELMRAVQRQLR